MHNYYKKYFFINKLDTKILQYQDNKTIIIYRNYNSVNLNEQLIINFKNYCKRKSFKFLIANNFKLAIKLKLNGAYIPSFNSSMSHLNYCTNKSFMIVGSAHNIQEIRIKEKQRVSHIVLSSIFKNNENYLGLYRFNTLKNLTKKSVIALGGINNLNKKKLKLINCFSFAGISYFQKKRPLKKGPLN